MPRQKKDGKNISFYMDRVLVERIHALAEERGQTLTVAVERLLKKALDDEDAKRTPPVHSKNMGAI